MKIIAVIHFLHKIIVFLSRIVIVYFRGEHGKTVSPISNPILSESATSLAQKIRTRELTSVAVVKAFIERIREINPLLNCVVDDRFQDALKDAANADALINSGALTENELALQKPFLGVPISTKDCIMVKDMLNTCGIYRRRNYRCTVDSDAMCAMRNSGAIPFALTNVPEGCMWWECNNTIYGRTSNPYDTNRTPGGSSGGEGCLLSACGSPFGLGTDIGGSIRIPALFNGIFGHKPSQSIVSNNGQYPLPDDPEILSFLTIGPMSKFACDLKPMLKILANENASQLNLDEPVDLKKIKYFYQENDGGSWFVTSVNADIRDGLQRVVNHLKLKLNADVKKVQIKQLKNVAPLWFDNMKIKNSPGIVTDLLNIRGKIRILKEIVMCIFSKSKHTFQTLLLALKEQFGSRYGSPEHKLAIQKKNELGQEIGDLLGTNGVLIYPVHPTVAPYHGESVLRAFNCNYTGTFNILGLPATAVPLGLGRMGLPIGVQVIAGMNQDRLCLAVATELEKVFGGWVAPTNVR